MKSSKRADAVIRDHTGWSIAAGLIPIPVGDVLAVTALQVDMLAKLAEIYDQRFSRNLGKSIVASLTGTSLARITASAIKAVPGVGTLIGLPAQAALAGASTYAVGHLFKAHFAAGGSLDTFNPDKMREAYEAYTERGREFVEELREERVRAARDRGAASGDSVHNAARTLRRLARLRDAGDLSPEQYERLKQTLIQRVHGTPDGRGTESSDSISASPESGTA